MHGILEASWLQANLYHFCLWNVHSLSAIQWESFCHIFSQAKQHKHILRRSLRNPVLSFTLHGVWAWTPKTRTLQRLFTGIRQVHDTQILGTLEHLSCLPKAQWMINSSKLHNPNGSSGFTLTVSFSVVPFRKSDGHLLVRTNPVHTWMDIADSWSSFHVAADLSGVPCTNKNFSDLLLCLENPKLPFPGNSPSNYPHETLGLKTWWISRPGTVGSKLSIQLFQLQLEERIFEAWNFECWSFWKQMFEHLWQNP